MLDQNTKVVTRVAPSPTGWFHVGTARTALFNFLYARHYGGTFLVRIEDTDRARSTAEFEQDIVENMRTLGIEWDGFVRQSERVAIHRAHLQALVDADKAYISKEPAKDDVSRIVEVVRLRNPGRVVTFADQVRGDISFDTTELGDFVIARSIDDPLYHFAVVVDDAEAGVTHVIRGEDHISNTPRQILIQEALGFYRPVYAHLPLILATDRSKMSKRKGATAVRQFIADGYLPETLVNFLALLGWNSGTEQEIFSIDELITAFTLEGVQKSGAIFALEKLKWMNREHRRMRPFEIESKMLSDALQTYPELLHVLMRSEQAQRDILDRYATTSELCEAVSGGEYDLYTEKPSLDPVCLVWKKDPEPARTRERLEYVSTLLEGVADDDFMADSLEVLLQSYLESEGKGAVLWPLRYALSGKDRSPGPFVLLEALGKVESLARIASASASLLK